MEILIFYYIIIFIESISETDVMQWFCLSVNKVDVEM